MHPRWEVPDEGRALTRTISKKENRRVQVLMANRSTAPPSRKKTPAPAGTGARAYLSNAAEKWAGDTARGRTAQ